MPLCVEILGILTRNNKDITDKIIDGEENKMSPQYAYECPIIMDCASQSNDGKLGI